MKVNNTIWSKKGLELFNLYNQNEADDSQSISKYITDIDQKILEDIVNNGGNLKELLVLQKKNTTAENYLDLLKNRINIKKYIEYIEQYTILPITVLKLLKNNIDVQDYIYLTQSKPIPLIDENKFWFYANNSIDINHLASLYKLGYDEKKFLLLKEKNINIQYFVNSLSKGISEEDFFKLRDKNLSTEDLIFFDFFINQGHKKNDFYIARIFGQKGYPQFIQYLKNRKSIILNLSFTLSLSFISIGLFSVAAVMSYYEYDWKNTKQTLWKDYFRSTDSNEKYDILLNKIPEAEKKEEEFIKNKYIFFSIAAVVTSSIIVPAIFLGYFSYKSRKMLDIFSMINIDVNRDYFAFWVRLSL